MSNSINEEDVERCSMNDEREQLSKLVLKRRYQKGSLTKAINIINTTNWIATSVNELKRRAEDITRTREKFDIIQSTIDELEIADVEENEKEREEFDERYIKIMAQIDNLVEGFGRGKEPLELPSFAPGMSGNLNETLLAALEKRNYLPDMSLPSFSGDYQKWPTFKNTFTSLVAGTESKYSMIQRFHYLRSCLKGEALSIIEGLEICDTTYNTAFEMLTKRYENRRRIVLGHVRALLRVEPADNSSSSLRRMFTQISTRLMSLRALKEPVGLWDTLLVGIVLSKLDEKSMDVWELSLKTNDLPPYSRLEEFLEKRCNTLEAFEENRHSVIPTKAKEMMKRNINEPRKCLAVGATGSRVSRTSSFSITCPVCSQTHGIYACETFLALKPESRYKKVSELRLCFNCLSEGHGVKDCNARGCRHCMRKHNTLLHNGNMYRQKNVMSDQEVLNSNTSKSQGNTDEPKVLYSNFEKAHTVLATARVRIRDSCGKIRECRAILDSGSQVHLITDNTARLFKSQVEQINIPISGVGNGKTHSKSLICLQLLYPDSSEEQTISFYVVPRVTGLLPGVCVNYQEWKLPSHITNNLADPTFDQPGEIELLLGADIFFEILNNEAKFQPGSGLPYVISTRLGWVVSGHYQTNESYTEKCFFINDEAHEDDDTKVQYTSGQLLEHKECEDHFKQTIKRTESGRFEVCLPFKEDPLSLGDSFTMAKTRFFRLEKRFKYQSELYNAYKSFMDEYISLGHMQKVVQDTELTLQGYFCPHHPVIRQESKTTQVRVVFDASAPASTNKSLNDILMTGPVVQNDLITILLNFRTKRYALTADVAKMYRQILVAEQDRKYQKIVWRETVNEKLNVYELNTVTYGTASAPFQATRCLLELAEQSEVFFPRAAYEIRECFYVDDYMGGANTIDECQQLHTELSTVFHSAGMELRKWCSNSPEILSSIQNFSDVKHYALDREDTIKTLGLLWEPKTDHFKFQYTKLPLQSSFTKRMLLSESSKIFDPLGFLSPILIRSKIFIQQLWLLQYQWDTILPTDMVDRWISFSNELASLQNLYIPRYVPSSLNNCQYHGFCDASEAAISACMYVRTLNNQNTWQTNLLCAKARVTSVKQQSIPRLELCAMVLLTKLAVQVSTAHKVEISQFQLWSDSTTAISWVRGAPGLWKTYVANRVSYIQEKTNNAHWKHICSRDNPADPASRGVSVTQLLSSKLWWRGPPFLQTNEEIWKINEEVNVAESLERKKVKLALNLSAPQNDTLDRFSSWSQLIRFTAWALRFRHRPKQPMLYLTSDELKRAEERWFGIAQSEYFSKEIQSIKAKKALPTKGKLKNLIPFLDDQNILRITGRLQEALITYDQKHPVILPSEHVVTELYLTYLHKRLLHAGPQLLLAHARLRVWPIGGRKIVRRVVKKCLTCFHVKPTSIQPIMGNLPLSRVQPSRPFTRTGVDFCGPIMVKTGRRNTAPKEKGYIAVFICLVTRAIHLELVSGLSTKSFLGALRKFVARRGLCAEIYSDNGTNFVGAKKELLSLFKAHGQRSVYAEAAELGIHWKFIPPAAPNFGGIWEAAVKSMKKHLIRVVGQTALNYEEYSILLAQIEACLNSRPIAPQSNDPSEFKAITPAHFSIGSNLLVPDPPEILHIEPKNRWELIQQMYQGFWKQWNTEYLSTLLQPTKWKTQAQQLKVGDLVLIHDNNSHPLHWNMARITDVHPGKDTVVRVATIRLPDGRHMKRATSKLYPLPQN